VTTLGEQATAARMMAATLIPAELLQDGLRVTDPVMSENALFDRTFGAMLFDMDGTIINSIAAAERVWTAWAERHGLDVAAFLPTIHGVRAIETITALDCRASIPKPRSTRSC
jgi:hypothetical protein